MPPAPPLWATAATAYSSAVVRPSSSAEQPAAPGNLISGNAASGVEINDSTGTLIQGNLIGLDQTGTLALGNRGAGVLIDNGSVSNTIGAASRRGA